MQDPKQEGMSLHHCSGLLRGRSVATLCPECRSSSENTSFSRGCFLCLVNNHVFQTRSGLFHYINLLRHSGTVDRRYEGLNLAPERRQNSREALEGLALQRLRSFVGLNRPLGSNCGNKKLVYGLILPTRRCSWVEGRTVLHH